MSEKLYLPISILLSSLILSATLFLGFGAVSENLSTGLVVANTGSANVGSGNTGANAAPPTTVPSQQPSAPTVNMSELTDGGHIYFGDPKTAKVVIVEFSDFECPFCGRVSPTIKAITEKYGNNIAIVYRHFPLSFHPNAKPSAIASECAAEQGKFREYHDKLFANQTALATANLKQYAAEIGLDASKFNQCFDSSKYSSKVDVDFSLGGKSGVSGTPTFFINGQTLVGAQPQANFETTIDALLN